MGSLTEAHYCRETHKGITYRDQELVQVCVWEWEREQAREGGWERACAGELMEISDKRADGCYLHAEKKPNPRISMFSRAAGIFPLILIDY